MDFLAGSATRDIPGHVQLFAGSREVHTHRAPLAANVSFVKFEVIALNASGQIVKYVPGASDGTQIPQGIMCNAADNTGGSAGDVWSAYYTGGDFNYAALVFPRSAGSVTSGGTGNGTVTGISAPYEAVDETWTLTATAAAADGGTFSVVGSVSGAQAPATVGVAYDNGKVAFTINDGSTDFQVGATRVFSVTEMSYEAAKAAFLRSPIAISRLV
jgi:hypothetical protein